MVEDRVNNLLSKNRVEIKVDLLPWSEDKWSSDENWKIYCV